ncbi:MAG: magnesium transporter CorA family protein [Solirubrobacterales bacterium]|nr:magnesium transporter CorA family protein [Solirubrobacterales bacterium]
MRVLEQLDRDEIARLLDAGEFFWLDLAAPSGADVQAVGEVFGLHPLAVEDSAEFGQRPKLDDYGETALLVFYGVHDDGRLAEVHLHLSGSWMVTLRADGDECVAAAKHRFAAEDPRSEEEAIYRVLDTLADSFFPVLDRIDEQIDALMDEMVERPRPGQRHEIFELRRRLVELRRVVGPQRDVMARGGDLVERMPGLEADHARDWFRDVYDHLMHLSETIDSFRDILSGALDVYLSTQSNRLNEVTKQLTLVATIFLPLTFVTGFFGQNFGTLVRHINTPLAFWAYGVGVMLASAALLYAWFRRSGFFQD